MEILEVNSLNFVTKIAEILYTRESCHDPNDEEGLKDL